MKTVKIPPFADRVAEVSRRSSLLALGALVLSGAGHPSAAKGAAKARKARRKLCKRQVAPCREGVIAQCAGAAFPEACEALFLPCCDILGGCNGRDVALCFVQLA